jgi:hypothetical protein
MDATSSGAIVPVALAKAHELLEALDPSRETWLPDPTTWVFRGQDCDDPLIPNALRSEAHGEHKLLRVTENPPEWDEFAAVRDFLDAADRAGLPIPHDAPHLRMGARLRNHVLGKTENEIAALTEMRGTWPKDDLLAIVALAQHYGVPTRLLDWTYKPQVACYFASAKLAQEACGVNVPNPRYDGSKAMVIWALNKTAVPNNLRGKSSKFPRVAIVGAPQASNPNLAAQGGLFTLDREAEPGVGFEATLPRLVADYLAVANEEYRAIARLIERFGPIFYKFTLPHTEARSLLRLLNLRGTSAATVFPGHRGVVDSLYEKRYWLMPPWSPKT